MVASSVSSPDELVSPKVVCSSPYMALGGLVPVPCGQCKACRLARKLRVVQRAELERMCHADACCATLTYSDAFVGDGNVRPAEWKRVKERLYCQVRKDLGIKLRFFGIGEYGENFGRPHWHVIAFGLPLALGHEYWERAWTDPASGELMGRIDVQEAEHSAIKYIAGYAMKKMTRWNDPWLEGRSPEFVIRPNRPGLGLGFVDDVVSAIRADPLVLDMVQQAGDIPARMRMGRGLAAMDKLFKQKVRAGVLGADQAEAAREAHASNYLQQCRVGRSDFGLDWALGAPAVDRARVVRRVKRASLYASRKSL